VAAGVAKAADDAAALVGALAVDDVAPALERFEAARLPVGRRIIERARHLGAYLQATQTAEERARSQRHSIPEAVLAETAVLDFLREEGRRAPTGAERRYPAAVRRTCRDCQSCQSADLLKSRACPLPRGD